MTCSSALAYQISRDGSHEYKAHRVLIDKTDRDIVCSAKTSIPQLASTDVETLTKQGWLEIDTESMHNRGMRALLSEYQEVKTALTDVMQKYDDFGDATSQREAVEQALVKATIARGSEYLTVLCSDAYLLAEHYRDQYSIMQKQGHSNSDPETARQCARAFRSFRQHAFADIGIDPAASSKFLTRRFEGASATTHKYVVDEDRQFFDSLVLSGDRHLTRFRADSAVESKGLQEPSPDNADDLENAITGWIMGATPIENPSSIKAQGILTDQWEKLRSNLRLPKWRTPDDSATGSVETGPQSDTIQRDAVVKGEKQEAPSVLSAGTDGEGNSAPLEPSSAVDPSSIDLISVSPLATSSCDATVLEQQDNRGGATKIPTEESGPSLKALMRAAKTGGKRSKIRPFKGVPAQPFSFELPPPPKTRTARASTERDVKDESPVSPQSSSPTSRTKGHKSHRSHRGKPAEDYKIGSPTIDANSTKSSARASKQNSSQIPSGPWKPENRASPNIGDPHESKSTSQPHFIPSTGISPATPIAPWANMNRGSRNPVYSLAVNSDQGGTGPGGHMMPTRRATELSSDPSDAKQVQHGDLLSFGDMLDDQTQEEDDSLTDEEDNTTDEVCSDGEEEVKPIRRHSLNHNTAYEHQDSAEAGQKTRRSSTGNVTEHFTEADFAEPVNAELGPGSSLSELVHESDLRRFAWTT